MSSDATLNWYVEEVMESLSPAWSRYTLPVNQFAAININMINLWFAFASWEDGQGCTNQGKHQNTVQKKRFQELQILSPVTLNWGVDIEFVAIDLLFLG